MDWILVLILFWIMVGLDVALAGEFLPGKSDKAMAVKVAVMILFWPALLVVF